jgi:hypothetical protein
MPPMGPGWPPQDPQGNPWHAYPPTYPGAGNYPSPGYPPPPGHQFGHPGYPYQPVPLQPGVIPLRPLTVSDIFNGAIRYIRANPKATLGLTTAVVVVAQIISLAIQIGPLAVRGRLQSLGSSEAASTEDMLLEGTSTLAGGLIEALAGIVLSGMLAVAVGRAVFGSPITVSQAWQRVRGRLAALLGISVLQGLGIVVLIGVTALIVAGIALATNGFTAFVVGAVVGLPVSLLAIWLWVMLSFAPVAIVLEQKPIWAAITRSFALVRNGFWRVLGIRMLAGLVAAAIAMAVAMPFAIAQVIATAATPDSTGAILLGAVSTTIGGVIGQIITAPFLAGVIVLLYTDRRIRAEAFDLVLRTGATGGPLPGSGTDHLWLAGP